MADPKVVTDSFRQEKSEGGRRREKGIEDRLAEGAEQIGKVDTDGIGVFLQIGGDGKVLESPKGLQPG
ncbi:MULTISPECIES: hypothetical protein [unclassified Parabacteroides]|uniref:hypothetical protein n=1 Tax=unclassified Parabacteroides TaxID=2649774 RepID=UPI002476F2A9|nr:MULTISPECIES: hypothetical protein [unclassified Parabacteroides]